MEELFNKLLILYPEYSRIYGPYTRKDGRKHILLYKQNVSEGKRTLSWPKAIVEVREGRRLTADETVDHNNQDFTDNSSDNLIIRARKDHIKLDAVRLSAVSSNCLRCGKAIILTESQIRTRAKSGPFCSRKCSGAYGADIQNGRGEIKRIDIKRTYHTAKGIVILSSEERQEKINSILQNEKLKKEKKVKKIIERKERKMIDLSAPVQVICVWCKKEFTTSLKRLRYNRKCAGPFCSNQCTSKYGTSILQGKAKLPKKVF